MTSFESQDGGASVTFEGESVEICGRCGAPLGEDPDDDPVGGPGGQPLCGECERNRNDAADFEAADILDGELDGVIDF